MKEDKKDLFFARHMMDLADRAYRGDYPVFSDFLTTREDTILRRLEKEFHGIDLILWGGHPDCDHRMAGFFPKNQSEYWREYFPVSILHIISNDRHSQGLQHRDFLGAILNLGMERSKIGDIRMDGQDAFVFCSTDFLSFIQENLTTVKHTSVRCDVVMNPTEIPSQQLTERTGSVASVRLDNIVSAATGLSRTKSAELIRQGAVIADHEEKNSVSFLCRDEMILTVRGYGKFRLGIPENSFTKKGKQKIIIYKYV